MRKGRLTSMQPESFSNAIQRLGLRGFTHGLSAESGRLLDLVTGEYFDPEILAIAEIVRFEIDERIRRNKR